MLLIAIVVVSLGPAFLLTFFLDAGFLPVYGATLAALVLITITARTFLDRAERETDGNPAPSDSDTTPLELVGYEIPTVPSCPRCGGADAAYVLYGMPALTDQLLRHLDTGRGKLVGCGIEKKQSRWICNHCEHKYD